MDYQEAKTKLEKYNQAHLLKYYDELTEDAQKNLLDSIARLDLALLNQLYDDLVVNKTLEIKGTLADVEAKSLFAMDPTAKQRYWDLGMEALSQGKVAALLLAGGQGTRLGFDGPKGTFDLGLPSGWTIFRIHAERLKNISRRAGHPIPWYIMTSPGNNSATVEHFQANDYFGLNPSDVHFFTQTTLPSLDMNGKLIMANKGVISSNPDGGGGCVKSLQAAGLLQDMKQRGIEQVFFFGVDNILARVCDPYFIGFARSENLDVSSKSVLKKTRDEKVGVFALRDGHPTVIEYTEVPPSLESGSASDDFPYRSSNILMHVFKMSFIEKCLASKPEYHSAHKKVDYLDETGAVVKPDKPNAYKFETFYFDLFKLGDGMSVLNVAREEEFSPVKNLEGDDSKDTALAMIYALHRKWLQNHGITTAENIELPMDQLIFGDELTKPELLALIDHAGR